MKLKVDEKIKQRIVTFLNGLSDKPTPEEKTEALWLASDLIDSIIKSLKPELEEENQFGHEVFEANVSGHYLDLDVLNKRYSEIASKYERDAEADRLFNALVAIYEH